VAPNALLEGTLLEVGGHGFKYLFSRPTGAGTVTDLTVHLDDVLVYKLSEADVELRDIFDADIETATRKLFEGDDKFEGSTGNDKFTGHEGDDKFAGKGGDDTLLGKAGKDTLDGGEGSDTLNGGSGKDAYLFKTAPGAVDTIVKFQSGETIKLAKSAFAGLTDGKLAADQFVIGQDAGDENDHVIYDPTSGALYFDPDGDGSAARTKFAQMQPSLDNFSADNILVI